MDNKERDAVIDGVRLLGSLGRNAGEAVREAVTTGELSHTDALEALAQLEDALAEN